MLREGSPKWQRALVIPWDWLVTLGAHLVSAGALFARHNDATLLRIASNGWLPASILLYLEAPV